MARVKRGTTTHARHAKVIKAAKGYYGRRKNTFRTATQAVDKARQYAYRDRRTRKREFRALWIQRINAAARMHGMTYSQMMSGLIKAGIEVVCSTLHCSPDVGVPLRALLSRAAARATSCSLTCSCNEEVASGW